MKMKRMVLILVLILLLCAAGGCSKREEVFHAFYLSPTGSDLNDGTKTRPFQSFEKVLEEIRQISDSMTLDIVVYLRGGIYELRKAVAITPEDSGKNGYRIIFRSYPNEQVLLSGGQEITGWTQAEGRIWSAPCDAADLRQLYIDGQRGKRSILEAGITTESINLGEGSVMVGGGDLISRENPGSRMEIVRRKNWNEFYIPVKRTEVSGSSLKVYPSEPMFFWNTQLIHTNPWLAGDMIQLENAYAFLDEKDEWFYDADAKRLFLVSDTDPNERLVIAPVCERLLEIKGDKARTVENITFESLNFAFSAWNEPSVNGYAGWQGGMYLTGGQEPSEMMMDGAIEIEHAQNISFSWNTMANLGAAAVNIRGNASGILIENNIVRDTAGSGIIVGNKTKKPGRTADSCSGVSISNNLIYNIARDYHQNVAIEVLFAQNVEITNNDICQTPYTGISVGWFSEQHEENTRHIKVRNNRIERTVQMMKDGGAIYTLGNQPGTEILENHILGVKNFKAAVYHDETSGNIVTCRNVIEDIGDQYWVNIWHHTAHDISVSGNFSDSAKYDIQGTHMLFLNNTMSQSAVHHPEAVSIKEKAGLSGAAKKKFTAAYIRESAKLPYRLYRLRRYQ